VKLAKRLKRDESGVAVIEMAFALPVLIIMIWMIIQLGLVFRAMAGIQHALGEGARVATLWPVPTKTIVIPTPATGTADGSNYLDLEVTYTQPTDLLIIPGPTISVSRSKRVWVSESDT